MPSLDTLSLSDLSTVTGGFDHDAAAATAQTWRRRGAAFGAGVGVGAGMVAAPSVVAPLAGGIVGGYLGASVGMGLGYAVGGLRGQK
jgi:hypothetical protein